MQTDISLWKPKFKPTQFDSGGESMSKGMHCPLCGEIHQNLEQHLQESHTMEELQQAFQPEVQVMNRNVRSANFLKHYAIEVDIEMTPIDIRIYAVNEMQPQQAAPGMIVENRIMESAFILPPFAAKTLHENLGKTIKDFENQYGKINLPN